MDQRRSAEHRDLSALAPELSQSLLAWWEIHGRKDPALKPWMFTKDGRWRGLRRLFVDQWHELRLLLDAACLFR